ncbi:MAG TPA: TonB-dependent receptor [Thermoanaerobaculia bacterium]|nr:TonB-dependent receptor [Thermoanaerobaculia bacterium]
MRRSIRVPILALIVLSLLIPTFLLAQTSAGALGGRVADESGGALPGVTVTATNSATGFSRNVVTGSDGAYRFQALPVGTYNVTADLSGFTSVTTRNVDVSVATERTINFTLKQASVKEQITVTAEAPLVETSPAVGTTISQREMENLPLNGRQFANLGSLAPGTTLSVNSDPTKPGQLTIALNGGSGRNVNFVVDGGDNTDDTIGGALQNYNIEAVQEFKIQTQQYKAEYGRTTGGVLTVVTKTGTNEFAGNAYEFYRDKSLNTESQSEQNSGSGKTNYRRNQYGATLGGPIVKDRAHFFITAERLGRRTNYVIDTTPPSSPSNPNPPPIYPEFQGQAVPTPFRDDLLTAKVSGDINPKQFLQVRYGYQKNTDIYGASPVSLPSALGTLTNKYRSLLVGHTFQLGSDKLNEFLFQNTHFANAILPVSDDPFLFYPSGVSVGQNINTPQTTDQIKRQYKDDFSWTTNLGGRRNDFKFGANYIDEPLLGGDFSTGLAGQYNLLSDQRGSPISEITIQGGFAGYNTPIKQYNYYAQDDISVNNKLTLNVGLRYDLWKGFDIDQTNNPIWQVLSTQTKYNDPYLKDFQGGKGGKLDNDTNNWAPRLGFTYDMNADSKHILRGGVGRYFDFPYTNATILFPAVSIQSNYGTVYHYRDPNGIRNANGTFFQPGQPLPPNQLPSADINPPNEVASPTLATPYSDQISLGYSWQVNPWLGLNVDASHIKYRDLPFRFRGNPTDPTTGQARFPQFGSFRIWYGNGFADYNGINLGGHARLGDKFELQGFYTLSHTTGNILAGADEFRITAADYQPDLRGVRDQTVDPYDPLCNACEGPLNTDARHRITLSALYRAPLGINVSGIVRWHSATPYTDWLGHDYRCGPDGTVANTTTPCDGYAFDLSPGVSHVNTLRGDSFSQTDIRIAKEFRVQGHYGIELIGEVFNLFNSKNATGFRGNREIFNTDQNKFVPNPAFGTPARFAGDPGQGEQRLAQLGIRLSF